MAKSFPDLNNDGEVTQADVLKGRGVYKKGGKVKKKRYEDGGEVEFEPKSSALKMLEYMRSEPKSDLDQLRSNLKSTGRAGMAGAKAAAESIPMVRGAKDLASRVGQKNMPKSYDEEKGMKKGGKVSSASKRADGIAIRGKTRA
jgi:hypothetical protein